VQHTESLSLYSQKKENDAVLKSYIVYDNKKSNPIHSGLDFLKKNMSRDFGVLRQYPQALHQYLPSLLHSDHPQYLLLCHQPNQ